MPSRPKTATGGFGSLAEAANVRTDVARRARARWGAAVLTERKTWRESMAAVGGELGGGGGGGVR